MHRLVFDQLLDDRRRRVPGDLAELQEAHVEPARQQRFQIRFEVGERLVLGRELEQGGAHVDQELHPVGQRVELGQQPEPRRLQRGAELALAALAPAPVVELVEPHRGGGDGLAVGVELGAENAEEARAPLRGERHVGAAERGGAGPRGDLAAATLQAGAHLPAHPVGVAPGEIGAERRRVVGGARGDVPPLAEHPLKGPLQQVFVSVHRAIPSSRSRAAARNRYPSFPGAATSWTPSGKGSPGSGTDKAG